MNYFSNSNYEGGRYGNMSSYIGLSTRILDMFMQYRLDSVLRHKIQKITLVETRKSIYDDWQEGIPAGRGVHAIVSAFIARDSENPEIASKIRPKDYPGFEPDDSLYSLLPGGFSITDEAYIGVIERDITSFFDTTKSQKGILGIKYGGTSLNTIYANSDFYLKIEYELRLAPNPTSLLPVITQNPHGPITLSWWTNLHEDIDDPQTGTKLIYWQDSGDQTIVNISGTQNEYILSANTFLSYEVVSFTVQTITQYNGVGLPAYGSFPLGTTPPLRSILIFPLNASVNGINGVPLEWQYNSPYDTFPSRFDVRYRVDDGAWITKTNYSSGNNPAHQSAMTEPITTQSTVDWQVMAYGQLGDAGPWSEIGTFFTIGPPSKPVIVSVTNSNRPTINFSATDLMSWELEITHNNIIIYQTGNQVFISEFRHVTNQFFANGNYLARMRVTNEYGLTSDWGTLPFTINTVAPAPLKLQITRNTDYYVRLRFNNTGKTVYIYRSELRKGKYLRIGMTKWDVYDDYTARPRQRYEYFVRVVNPDWSFADSNIETGSLRFMQTTIAEYDTPSDMLMLWKMIDGKPTKNISFDYEKTLTQFVGREFPVLQVGSHASKSLSLSFYCTIADYERLEEMHRSYKVLLLRDWRLGSIFGTINGSISANREADGCIVSFSFLQVDFDEEIELT